MCDTDLCTVSFPFSSLMSTHKYQLNNIVCVLIIGYMTTGENDVSAKLTAEHVECWYSMHTLCVSSSSLSIFLKWP